MWLLEFLFFLLTFLIGWTLFGYLLAIWFVGLFREHRPLALPAAFPALSVVIPCYNEESQILAKLEDVRSLDYPRECLEIVFVDGGSTDHTIEQLMTEMGDDRQFRVIECPRRGKINQLNYVLPQLRGEIIVNTDVDARLSPDALKWLAAEFVSAPDAWVVGAYCRPAHTLAIESYYWDGQNKGRFLESNCHTTSIVIAECYAFRRELLTAFPDDVIADDIYVAFLANTLGYRTIYSQHARAVETRSPQRYEQFLAHKFRKSNAFLRESLRFLYRLPEMSPFCKTMHITHTAQQFLLPWALLFWVLVAGVLLSLFRFDVVIFGVILLMALLLMTSTVFGLVPLPDGPRRYSFFTIVSGYFLTTLIMLMTGISYPFFQQGSTYARLYSPCALERKDENHEPNL